MEKVKTFTNLYNQKISMCDKQLVLLDTDPLVEYDQIYVLDPKKFNRQSKDDEFILLSENIDRDIVSMLIGFNYEKHNLVLTGGIYSSDSENPMERIDVFFELDKEKFVGFKGENIQNKVSARGIQKSEFMVNKHIGYNYSTLMEGYTPRFKAAILAIKYSEQYDTTKEEPEKEDNSKEDNPFVSEENINPEGVTNNEN